MFFSENFLNTSKTYALVGASSSSQDHAYHLFLALEKSGYTVIPLSITDTQVCGVPAYPSLLSIPAVDGIIFATFDEEISLNFLKQMRDSGLHTAWFEDMPGMMTPEMENFAEENFFEVVKNENLLSMVRMA